MESKRKTKIRRRGRQIRKGCAIGKGKRLAEGLARFWRGMLG
jgi:hypothetical protein